MDDLVSNAVVESPAPVADVSNVVPLVAPIASEPALPTATPEAEDVTPATIDEYNRQIQASEGDVPADKPDEAEEIEEIATSDDADDLEAEAVTDDAEFKLDTDIPFEEFEEQKRAYLETVEVTPELQAILDRQEAEIAAAREQTTVFEAAGNRETVQKVAVALGRLFETDLDPVSGTLTVNAAPLITELRTAYRDEFRPIMEEGLSQDSMKYQGASILEEILIDSFGADKAQKMIAFGQAAEPLPVTPPHLLLPAGLEDSHKEAYLRLSDAKRSYIQALVDDVTDLREEISDATEWRKEEIAADLREKQALLDDEYYAIKTIQQNLNGERARAATAMRQQSEQVARYRHQVHAEYNKELFELADTLVADLAPRLTYADGDSQVSQARNIMARVNNALAFNIGLDGSVEPDPMADFYAKQLASEGVKFDFSKGRELLQAHYKATEKLTALKLRNANAHQLELATRERNKIMFDIKVEQKTLLGQLSSRYVKSSASAIGKQVTNLQAKKQAVKAIVPGRPDRSTSRKDPMREIAEYNRQVQASNPEELYDSYQN
jgi:hypothetical protein